jgi:hypothetical protein
MNDRRLLRKEDADKIFEMTKSEWEANAQTFSAPGWEVRFRNADEGLRVAAVDSAGGLGFVLMPFYKTESGLPELVIVRNYFQPGKIPKLTDQLKKDIEAEVKASLGTSYSVSVVYHEDEQVTRIEFFLSRVISS